MKTGIALALTAIFAVACSTDSAKTADTMAIAGDTAMTPAPEAAAPAPPPTAESLSGMWNPNTMSDIELTAAGVSSAAATALVAARPYKSMVDVDKILAKSLNEKQRDSVYARVWIPIDLNTATGDEILLIPGVGSRMRHEFEEYRPYTSIEQFRREIGKYVDKAEVARLEKYVAIK